MGLETAIFVGAMTAFSAASASSASKQQNQAIGRSQASLFKSTEVAQQQLADSASLERLKVARNAAQIEGRIRAARGTSGQGMAGSTLAILRQNDITEAENIAIIGQNLRNQNARVQSGFEAEANRLNAGLTNPNLAAVMGGLSGLNSGISLSQGFAGISKSFRTREPDPFQPVNIL